MSRTVQLEVTLPDDWKTFRLPKALDDRLQELLDLQDTDGRLTAKEKREAEALVELVDILSLMKARSSRVS